MCCRQLVEEEMLSPQEHHGAQEEERMDSSRMCLICSDNKLKQLATNLYFQILLNISILNNFLVFLLQWVVRYLGKSMYQLDLWLVVSDRTWNNTDWFLATFYKVTSPPTLFPPCRDTIGFISWTACNWIWGFWSCEQRLTYRLCFNMLAWALPDPWLLWFPVPDSCWWKVHAWSPGERCALAPRVSSCGGWRSCCQGRSS